MLLRFHDRFRGLAGVPSTGLLSVMLVALALAACGGSSGSGSGDGAVDDASALEARTMPDFDAVIIDNGVLATVDVDPEATGDVQLQVSADPDHLDRLITTVDDRTLTASVVASSLRTSPTRPFEVSGEVASLRDVVVRNGASVTLRGPVGELTVSALGGAMVDAAMLRAETVVVDADNGAQLTICASDSVTGSVSNGASLTVLCGGDTTGVVTGNAGTVTTGS